jgi:dipeptidyl aminopeptidase/acylaminoacyl peptidase
MSTREESGSSTTKLILIVAGVAGTLLLLMLLACGGAAYMFFQGFGQIVSELQGPDAPEMELQEQDYAQARSQFQTKLVQQGSAPQDWKKLQPPPGVEEIEYPSGNLRLRAWINPPKQGGQEGKPKKLPAVLFLHGGYAFDREDWDMTRPYRDRGYVVMTPTLRGENGQPGNYTLYYDEVDDVLAAAEHLAKLPYVDPTRIYVAGHEAGGTLTMLAAQASNRFRAAASFSGYPNQAMQAQVNPGLVVPFDQTDIREFQLRSPVAYATSFKCPVRLYYGKQEIFLTAETQRIAALAQARNLDVEAVQVPGNQMTAVTPAMQQSLEFFQKN